MVVTKLLLLMGLACVLLGCQGAGDSRRGSGAKPPVAKVVPHEFHEHGGVRVDDYYWLREREDPEVIAYLEAENAYTEQVMKHTAALQESLFEEIKGRIKQTDNSVPYKLDDYYYYSRFEEGKDYPFYCRKRATPEGPAEVEEVMLDVNAMAEGHDFFLVGRSAVSYGQDLLAYAVDTVGRRKYTVHFKNLDSGELLPDRLADVTGNMAWANDNRTLFYTKQDPETLRSYRVYRHLLGTDPAQDELVYEEQDETFACYVLKTKSKRYVMIVSQQTLSSEYRYIEADRPESEFRVFLPRRRDHEYYVDHYADNFYIKTNHQAKNFRLMRTPVGRTGIASWKEVIGHREDVLLEDFEIFSAHLVLEERRGGLVQLRVRRWDSGAEHYLDFGEPAYEAYTSSNYDFDTPVLRYEYQSMTTPKSVFDYDMESREKTLLKQDEILGGFDSADYATERLHATATDGTRVPISIVYRRGFERDGSHPLVLYAYGSYGYSLDATFSSMRLSLLDRGFAWAIAHVRGGQELGRAWYDDGKLQQKKNTFTDFVACAEHLIAEGYTRSDRLFAWGGSAGGLLVGAVINMRPDLWRGAIAAVPFVDVVTTMLDESIPLTTGEYDEWGDPREREAYEYILSYSPYDQIEAKAYPNLLVTAGLHDSQVQYWEPAKWVAKLRTMKTDDHRLLLKTWMEAGHGGVSGRYKQYRDMAFNYTFLLDLVDIRE